MRYCQSCRALYLDAQECEICKGPVVDPRPPCNVYRTRYEDPAYFRKFAKEYNRMLDEEKDTTTARIVCS
jgi:hypothetical protein